MRKLILTCGLFITACASTSTQNISSNSLKPYLTATPSLTPTANAVVIAETPVPTSAPSEYKIKAGDTFSQLAEQFKISEDDLRAANPDIQPNSMPVGGTLLIPDASSIRAARGATPTPVPVPVTQTVCHPAASNSLWCFALIHNDSAEALENVSAQITLLSENNNPLASQTASAPLDIIPPNSSLPVYASFPNVSPAANVQVQILTAYQSSNSNYLPATLNNATAQIDWNGLTAQLSGQVSLPAESKAATQTWVAAVAYNKDGQVVGVRRWEGGAMQPGGSIPFSFSVSSFGSAIDRVEYVIEVRP
jgi:murein DD-endopeptidase MepM/ murein hydrolase activator NlpD